MSWEYRINGTRYRIEEVDDRDAREGRRWFLSEVYTVQVGRKKKKFEEALRPMLLTTSREKAEEYIALIERKKLEEVQRESVKLPA